MTRVVIGLPMYRAAEFLGNPLRGALDVWFVLGFGADTRNPQKFAELGEVRFSAGARVRAGWVAADARIIEEERA